MKYPDLNTLFQKNGEARKFYTSLTDYVREQIDTRPGGINSLKSLQNYADNLTRSDD